MQRPDKTAIKMQAHVSHQYLQLMSGHGVTGTFLRRIEKRKSDQCWEFHSRSRADVHHIMFRYAACQKESTLLRQEHEKQVGLWPATVWQLLGSRKATQTALEFLATIRAGRRPRSRNSNRRRGGEAETKHED